LPVSVPTVRYFAPAISDPDAALAGLDREVRWNRTMRARATASFGRPYNYSGQSYPAVAMPPTVRSICDEVASYAGHDFNNCLCNLYDTGLNTMGFHRDSYEELEPSSWIAIVSIGAPRPLVFRGRDRALRASYTLEHGSLLLMDRATQDAWEHAVPRDPRAGRRISLTFRQFAVAS